MTSTNKSKSKTTDKSAPKDAKPSLKRIANVFDEITGTAQEIIGFTDEHGNKRELTIEREAFKKPQSIHDVLIRHNASISFDYDEVEEGINKLIKQKAKYVINVGSNGWLHGNQLYASPLGIFGQQPEIEFILSEQLKSLFGKKHLMTGNVQGWVKYVAKRALHSRIGTFSLCAAFAAPIVRYTELLNFSFNVFGVAKIGKSTITLAAASVGGIGDESDLLNHQTTQSAFNEVFRYYNDQLVALNEMSLARIGSKNIYSAMHQLTYSFAEGQIKRVNSKSSYATDPSQSQFKSILLTNSERSIDEYARQVKTVRQEGEYARMLCLPARRANYKTVMDIIPDDIPSHEIGAWTRKKIVKLRKACAKHRGHALQAYVEFLMSNHEGLNKKIKSFCQKFTEKVDASIKASHLSHAAENFALVYAGGCLAIEAGLLPTDQEHLLELLLELFHEAIANIMSSERTQDEILTEELNDYLAHAKIDKKSEYKRCYRMDRRDKHDGYYTIKNGQTTYTINAKQLRDQFIGQGLPDLLTMLHARGLLIVNPDKSEKGGTEWATHQRRFNDTNDRYFWFRWEKVKQVEK